MKKTAVIMIFNCRNYQPGDVFVVVFFFVFVLFRFDLAVSFRFVLVLFRKVQ